MFSWTIESHKVALKSLDKSVLLYNETGIPKGITTFFEAHNMKCKEKINLIIRYDGNSFSARLEKDLTGRVKMRWDNELGVIIKDTIKTNYDEIKNIYLRFEKCSKDIMNVDLVKK